MVALLRDLPQAVVIDNARELKSKELAKALTDTVLVGRVVRTSSTATIPIQCVWLANGNNVALHQEIARRVVRCRLDAEMEQPWRNRQFQISNLRGWLRDHRTQMIWACLTLIRSWFTAGCPSGSRSLGMYEHYSAVMGGILEHLDVGSYPADEMLPDATEDLQSEAESWFVSGWWAAHRDQPVQVANLLSVAIDEGSIVVEYWGGMPHSGAAKLGHFLRGMLGKTFDVPASHAAAAATVAVRRLTNDPVSRRARYQLVVRSTR